MEKIIEKANQLTLKTYVKADVAKTKIKNEVSELAHNEMGVSGLVVALILVAIAVVLAIIFRDAIAAFMQDIFDKLKDTTKEPDKKPTYSLLIN